MAGVGYWLYGAAIVASFCLSVSLTWYALQHRDQPIARTFAAFTTTLALYSFCIMLITFSDDRELAYFAARMRLVTASVVYLWYCAVLLDYFGGNGWRFLRRHWYLFIIPAMTSLISLSSKVDEWLFNEWELAPHGPINLETLHYHNFYFVYLTQYYAAALAVFVLLFRHATRQHGLYRRQAIVNMLVIFLAFLSGAQRNLGIYPEIPNLFPIGLLLVAMVLAWTIFSRQLLNVRPIAYSTIFEYMHDAAVVVDQTRRIVDLNPAAAQWLNPSTTLGRPIGEVLPDLATILESPSDNPTELALTVDDQTHCFEVRVTTLFHMQRYPAGYLLVLTDITTRKQAEREREQMIVALDAYAHTVAHDLKNPISLVLGYASLLQDELDHQQPELRDHVSKIIEASQKNVQIINELLLFASVRRRQDVEIRPIDMRHVVQAALRRLQPETDLAQAKIHLPDAFPTAVGYAAWVEEVWANLISNALKYGGDPPLVEIGGRVEKLRVRFWVRDNGKGLTAEEIQHLFSQEGRLKKHAHQYGHGFGIAIVRNIVERLGGSVNIESEVGTGTTFSFTLPTPDARPISTPPAIQSAANHTPPV
ncbi:MAG: hypothetical protein DPW16_22530 [Chloroflexi bacterium]|nr:hypothetical protein [Chloroflexota bacterium]